MAAPSTADRVAEAIAAHTFTPGAGCRCGVLPLDAPAEAHRAHLAEVIAPAFDLSAITYRAEIHEDPADPYAWGTVRIFAEGIALDRPEMSGYGVNSRAMAERLARAVSAGVVHSEPRVGVDINGKTYLHARTHVLGRIMNADLRRLGY